jgi:hypothetical protein
MPIDTSLIGARWLVSDAKAALVRVTTFVAIMVPLTTSYAVPCILQQL